MLLLGEEVERHGRIRAPQARGGLGVRRRLRPGRPELGAARVEVIVTAPGRQSANAEELVHLLALAAGAPARVVSADEEGRLAYLGAVASCAEDRETVAVCDVGGGSGIVVGTVRGGPAWLRSVDLGCVRLTERFLPDDPPGKNAVAKAADEAERQLEGIVPPMPQALATSRTARALRKLVGPELGPDELETAARRAANAPRASFRRSTGSTGAGRGRSRRAPSFSPRFSAGSRCRSSSRGRASARAPCSSSYRAGRRRNDAGGHASPGSGGRLLAEAELAVEELEDARRALLETEPLAEERSTTSPCVQRAGVAPSRSARSDRTSSGEHPRQAPRAARARGPSTPQPARTSRHSGRTGSTRAGRRRAP